MLSTFAPNLILVFSFKHSIETTNFNHAYSSYRNFCKERKKKKFISLTSCELLKGFLKCGVPCMESNSTVRTFGAIRLSRHEAIMKTEHYAFEQCSKNHLLCF